MMTAHVQPCDIGDGRVEPIRDADFTSIATFTGAVLRVEMSGNADLRAQERLGRFLRAMDAEALRLGIGEVVIDLRELQFMNSSCFKELISWITDMQERAEAQQYRINFASNPALHWQKRSLRALTCFADGLVSVSS